MTAMHPLPATPRIAVIGDSGIAALGVPRSCGFASLVAEKLSAAEVLDLSRSTLTVDHVRETAVEAAAFAPDLVLIGVGGADGLVHPSKWIEHALDRFGPKSWGGSTGLEPRAVFSASSRKRRIRQMITSKIKVMVKRVCLAFGPGYRRLEPGPFQEHWAAIGPILAPLGCTIVVVEPPLTDEKMFPRSNASLTDYRRMIRDTAATWPGSITIDPYAHLIHWDDYLADHAHYNRQGHEKVAGYILTALVDAGAWTTPVA